MASSESSSCVALVLMGATSAIVGAALAMPGSWVFGLLFTRRRFGRFGRGPGPARLTKLRSRSKFLGRSLEDKDLNRFDVGLFPFRVCLFSMFSSSDLLASLDSSDSSDPIGSSVASGAVLPGSEVVEPSSVSASATLLSP